MATRTIVFDLDGTLVDTAPDLIGSLNVLFARERLAPIMLDEGRGMIGGGVRRLIERGLASQGRTFTAAQVDELFADYVAHYAEHIADNSRPFPGVEAALDALAARGNRFAVCTNKIAWLSVRLLERLGLAQRFVAICGRDTFGIEKPDPEILRRTILAAGGDLADSLMVGDSGTDIATARAAGIPIVAVDFGYTEVPVAELDPDRIISHFDALPEAVDALMRHPAS
jgi:phosphoglycolate phosphatase